MERVWQLIREHFGVKTRSDLLDFCYAKFCKTTFSGLCAKLAKCARDEEDPLCRKLFEDAGQELARSVCALSPRISPTLISKCGRLDIVCVGSVWLSWELLEPGFTKELESAKFKYDLNLLNLTNTMALGAAYLAADTFELELPRDYSKNYEVFFGHRAVLNGSANGSSNGANGTNGTAKWDEEWSIEWYKERNDQRHEWYGKRNERYHKWHQRKLSQPSLSACGFLKPHPIILSVPRELRFLHRHQFYR